jgi:hypothetical protein
MDEESTDDIRAQLETAIANVRRQIDEQSRTRAMFGDGNSTRLRNGLVAQLQAELAELEDAMAGLEADDD